MHPLEALDWRLERAKKHLATLDKKQTSFLARLDKKNRRVVGEFDRDTSEYVFRVNGKPPDARLGIIVSEFGHHLRATLDNLVWQLVLLRGGSPTSKTQFPIYKCRERYQSSVWMIRGVSADDRALIETYQPFQLGVRAADSYLSWLAWLNNMDKHRFVHIGCARPRLTGISVSYGAEGEYAGQFPWHPKPVRDIRKILGVTYVSPAASDDRTELMRCLIDPCGANPEMEVEGDVPIEISVSDLHHSLTIRDLFEMGNLVWHIVDEFRPRFDIKRRAS
jgi:hypothetical protein